jgi:hypothetical protein
MIPRIAHFVFGLKDEPEPLHFLHYVSLESCRRVLKPEQIYLHHKHPPSGPWWERIRPHVTGVAVEQVSEVLDADYDLGRVPERYRYAHHADFIRLDALIEYGGVFADIDTIFLRPFPDEFFRARFVIGGEPPVQDERTGELRPSLCNALLLAEPGARFARLWRDEMAGGLDGTWSNHSGFLAEQLSRRVPDEVRVEPEVSFFSFPPSAAGLAKLLEDRVPIPAAALSVHLWAHLWWEYGRRDFSSAHAGWFAPPFARALNTTLASMVRPYLPDTPAKQTRRRTTPGASAAGPRVPATDHWGYLSLDEDSGYGEAARRCMAALLDSGLELEWTPFAPGPGWGLGYEPALPFRGSSNGTPEVLVAHLVPEYLSPVKLAVPGAFLVAHTVWDTDRLPQHWVACLNQADLIVVPSRFSADAIRASQASSPVAIVPHVAPWVGGGAPARGSEPDDVFVFYTIGVWTERKAISKTVEAYLRAFSGRDRVLLVVKTSHLDMRHPAATGRMAGEGTSAWSLARLLARHPDPPPVRLITRSMSDDEIGALHRRGDCYVSLCRSEGFGLGAFDAAAHGNPVVITGFGGQLDFLSGSPYLVNFDLVSVVDPTGLPSYAPDQHWADPDVEHGAALLRAVAGDHLRASAQAAELAVDIRQRYRPSAIAAALRSAIDQRFDLVTADRRRSPPTPGCA